MFNTSILAEEQLIKEIKSEIHGINKNQVNQILDYIFKYYKYRLIEKDNTTDLPLILDDINKNKEINFNF